VGAIGSRTTRKSIDINSYMHGSSVQIIPLSALVCHKLRIEVFDGVANPNLGEEEAIEGRGWYRSKERW